SENPLYNENSSSGTLSGPASEYGAFSDINELIEQTKHLFDQQDKLKKIAKRQKKLLAPFSKENVSAEIGELTALFNFSRRDEKMNVPATPFSEIPCSDFYQNHEIFAKGNASVPLTAYINNEQLPFVNVDSNGQVSVRISADDGLIQLTLPGRDLQFAAHKHHCIKLSGSASGFGQIVVVAEVWANNKMLVSNKSSLILVNAQSKKIDFPFDIDSAEDFSIALYIRIVGNLNVSLEMLSHKVGKRSGEKKSPLLYSPHNLSDSWNSGKKISAMLFAPEEEAYQGLINGERSFGVNISRDEYAVLRLDYNGQPLMCKTYSIELDFQSDSPCQVELCLESWSDKNQIVHRKTQTTSIDVGDNRIVIAAGSWDRQPIIPILFVKSPFAGKSVLKTIRKITPPKKANNPISFLFGKGASDTPAKPENETPSVKYQFYGQFNPPVDQFLFETYFKDRKEPGFFIECGAYDGRIDSSCLFFKETLGWKGANIEASRYLYRSLVVNRPGETNVFCALSDKAGTAVFRNAIHPELGRRFGNGSLNHTKEHIKELEDRNCEFEEYEVPTIPFRDLIEQYDIKQVDLFVLDVEGHELAVLKGMKGSSVLPSIICAEHGQLGVEALRGPMEELGYVYDAQSHVNSTWLLKSEQ
ncbi:MAG: FkbM family methyltransferase, partial [Devosiaceae bacterium]|nr:FkbM family methyltransferase [Devosiaceae bacterium]